MEHPPITSELMRMHTIRNPKPATAEALAAYISYPATESTFYTALKDALAVAADTTPVKLSKVKTAASNFARGQQFVASLKSWKTIQPNISRFREKLIGAGNQAATIVKAEATSNFPSGSIAPEVVNRAWDNLLAYNLVGGRQQLIQYAMDILRVDAILKAIKDNKQPHKRLLDFTASVLLPSAIFPLPQLETPAPQQEDRTESERTQRLRDLEDAKLIAVDLEKTESAIEKIKSAEAIVNENLRSRMKQLDPVKFDSEGNPILNPDALNEISNNTGRLTSTFMLHLDANAKSQLERNGISTEHDTVSHAIATLEARRDTLALKISKKLNLSQTVFATGGSVMVSPSIADFIATQSGSSPSVLKPGIPILIDGAPIFPGTAVAVDEAVTSFSDDTGCKVKPLGIADLRRVEQKLICNVPGEIAHIENIMKSEAKERATRRLQRSEDTTLLVTDSESQEERDTITTDRFQMEKATSKVLDQNQSFDVGVTIATGIKTIGGQIDISASSGYSSASASSVADEQAVSYAKEVTDRARKLVIERAHKEQTRKVIDEFEETNKHLYDNKEGAGHVVGLYRWVDKVYEAKVVTMAKGSCLK